VNATSGNARPEWSRNSPSAFIYWMRTGADELPADWVDDGEVDPATNRQRTDTAEAEQHALRSLSTDDAGRDAIDRDDDNLIEVPWPEVNPPSRRKDSEIGKLLDLLDHLPTGKESRELA
jgi:hypothetical protein